MTIKICLIIVNRLAPTMPPALYSIAVLLAISLLRASTSTGSAATACLSANRSLVNSMRIATLVSLYGGYQDYDEEHDDNSDEQDSRGISKSTSSTLSYFAKKSLSLTTKAVTASAQQSGKAAYWAIRPKQVDLNELLGLWRLDQQVILYPNDGPLESSTNLELTPKAVVVTLDGKPVPFSLTFTPARFPKSAKVEFTARTFIPIEDEQPPLFFYKGYVHRKLADLSVIKIKGKIYRVESTGWRGQGIKHVIVGTFLARKRLKLDFFDDDYDDEEGEAYDECSDGGYDGEVVEDVEDIDTLDAERRE